MAILDSVMARLGYVKLGRYGLALTPQGRIITTQPSILDDGFGGRVVGWERADLAELSLAVVPVGKAPPPPAPIPQAPPAPVQVAKIALQGIAQFTQPSSPKSDDVVGEADEDEPEDEDWEWQMAVARARAASDEIVAVVAKPALKPLVAPPPAPLTAPTGLKVTPPPVPTRAPKMTAPVIRDSSMVPPRLPAKQATVAPNHAPPAPLPPRRAARGTGPVAGDTTTKVVVAPPPKPAPAPKPASARPMPLAAPTEDTAIRARPATPPGRRPLAPTPELKRLEPMPVEDTRPDTRTEIKPAPLPRFSTRFAAAR